MDATDYLKNILNLISDLSRELSRFEEGTESEISHYYNDDETLRLVNAMANVIGMFNYWLLNLN